MTLIDTNVRNLRPDDVLFGSGQRVIVLGTVKRERATGRYTRVVEVETRKGDRRVRVWNASTAMRVERAGD